MSVSSPVALPPSYANSFPNLNRSNLVDAATDPDVNAGVRISGDSYKRTPRNTDPFTYSPNSLNRDYKRRSRCSGDEAITGSLDRCRSFGSTPRRISRRSNAKKLRCINRQENGLQQLLVNIAFMSNIVMPTWLPRLLSACCAIRDVFFSKIMDFMAHIGTIILALQ